MALHIKIEWIVGAAVLALFGGAASSRSSNSLHKGWAALSAASGPPFTSWSDDRIELAPALAIAGQCRAPSSLVRSYRARRQARTSVPPHSGLYSANAGRF